MQIHMARPYATSITDVFKIYYTRKYEYIAIKHCLDFPKSYP